MSNRKHVRIEYTLDPAADLDAYKARLARFVASTRAHAAGNEYDAYQHASEPRHFIHIGSFDEAAAAALQRADFFVEYTTAMKRDCEGAVATALLVPVVA